MTSAAPRESGVGAIVLGAGAVFIFSLLFAWSAGQIWEDYFITFRSSRNLVEGLGLVYQAGERVHTFTSPLGVLVPALGYRIFPSDEGPIWFLRVVSACALAGTAALLARHAVEQGWSRALWWLVLCLSVLEAKTVAFSTNGMESALLVFFAALAWREITRLGGPRVVSLAIAAGGLMWTRPDACVLLAAMLGGWWLFGDRRFEREVWRGGWARALLFGALLYLPWFIWAWSYYGSPVPQTIVAKSALAPEGAGLLRMLAAPLRCLVSETALDGLFAPVYANAGGWPRDLLNVARLLARLSAFLWLLPTLPRATRAASFAVLVGAVYFHQIMPYPWYYPPWTLLGAIALVGAAASFGDRVTPRVHSSGSIALAVVGICSVLLTGVQAHALRVQQTTIEEHGRKQIGLWLREHARPGDRVFLEPIGYVGYFSQLKILDYPGLCAPEVSALIRDGHRSYAELVDALHPEWLVLRPHEIGRQQFEARGTLARYVLRARWKPRDELDTQTFVPGRDWMNFDGEFLVFQRASASGADSLTN